MTDTNANEQNNAQQTGQPPAADPMKSFMENLPPKFNGDPNNLLRSYSELESAYDRAISQNRAQPQQTNQPAQNQPAQETGENLGRS